MVRITTWRTSIIVQLQDKREQSKWQSLIMHVFYRKQLVCPCSAPSRLTRGQLRTNVDTLCSRPVKLLQRNLLGRKRLCSDQLSFPLAGSMSGESCFLRQVNRKITLSFRLLCRDVFSICYNYKKYTCWHKPSTALYHYVLTQFKYWTLSRLTLKNRFL